MTLQGVKQNITEDQILPKYLQSLILPSEQHLKNVKYFNFQIDYCVRLFMAIFNPTDRFPCHTLCAGKATGLVTNTRVSHATPAALYAHSASRYWEDDSKVPEASRKSCKDIARQLVEDDPGRHINVSTHLCAVSVS